MAIRFDATNKFSVYKTDDGRMFCEGAFCRDGILKYQQPDGSVIYELRRPEVNQDSKTVNGFKSLPMVVEHPPCGLLNDSNYRQYTIGMSTDANTRYDAEFGGIVGTCTLYDSEAINYAESGEKVQLSAGYTCDLINKPGVWKGQGYDREQVNVKANHLALTGKGRAGEDVCLRLDSEQIGIAYDEQEKNMTTANIRIDGVEYEGIPQHIAPVLGSKMSELSTLQTKYDSAETKLSEMQQRLDDLEKHLQYTQGESDAFERLSEELRTIVGNADYVLGELGYKRGEEGIYVKTNSRQDADDDYVDEYIEKDDEEEYDDSLEEDEAEYLDPGEYIADTINAWESSEVLLPGFKEVYFDEEFSPTDIKLITIKEIYPDTNIEEMIEAGEGFIDGAYQRLLDELGSEEEEGDEDYEDDSEENRTDSSGYFDLTYAVQNTQGYESKSAKYPILNENYKKPLSIS